MVLKTFNLEENVYEKFSKFCRENGISMSKQINIFLKSQIEEEPLAKKEYIEKLEKLRKGKFIRVNNFAREFGLEWLIL